MPSNFSTMCHDARERVIIPAVPLAAIRRDAIAAVPVRATRKSRRTLARLFAGAAIIAGTAGAAVWNGAHLSFLSMGGLRIQANRLDFTSHPTPSDVRSAALHADFAVVLPAGIPGNGAPTTLGRAGASALIFQYDLPGAWRRSDHVLWIVLANPAMLSTVRDTVRSRYNLMLGGGASAHAVRWTIGSEEVSVFADSLTDAERAGIERAMRARARDQS